MKKKIAILSATVLSLSLMTTSVFAFSPSEARATKMSKANEKILSIISNSNEFEVSFDENTSEAGKVIMRNVNENSDKDIVQVFGESGVFEAKGLHGMMEGFSINFDSEIGGSPNHMVFFGDGIDKFLEENTTLTDEEKVALKNAYSDVESLQKQMQELLEKASTETDEAKLAEIREQIKDLGVQISEKLEPVSDIISKLMPVISFSNPDTLSIELAGSNLATITSEDVQKLLDENTTLTQDEKDKILDVYKEIAPLGVELSTLIEKIVNETDADKKAELTEQLKDIENQLSAAIEPIKDLVEKIVPKTVKSIAHNSSFTFDSQTIQRLLDANTTLTEAEKNEIKSAYSDIEPLQAQLKALFESMADENSDKEEIAAQMKEISEKIREKQSSLDTLLEKLLPEGVQGMLDGMDIKIENGSISVSGIGNGFRGGIIGESGMFSSIIGGLNLAGDEMLDKFLENNTTLTDEEKAEIKAVYSEIKPLQTQLAELRSQYINEDDEAVKEVLKSQMESIQSQIQQKLESIKHLTNSIVRFGSFDVGSLENGFKYGDMDIKLDRTMIDNSMLNSGRGLLNGEYKKDASSTTPSTTITEATGDVI